MTPHYATCWLIYSPVTILAAAHNTHTSRASRRFGNWLCPTARLVYGMYINRHVNYIWHIQCTTFRNVAVRLSGTAHYTCTTFNIFPTFRKWRLLPFETLQVLNRKCPFHCVPEHGSYHGTSRHMQGLLPQRHDKRDTLYVGLNADKWCDCTGRLLKTTLYEICNYVFSINRFLDSSHSVSHSKNKSVMHCREEP
jgi:hypothetical protein